MNFNEIWRWAEGQRLKLGKWTQKAVVASLLLASQNELEAFRFSSESGELTGNLDTTLTHGINIRTDDRHPSLVGPLNGGSAVSSNGDDGNLNYDQWDVFSHAIRFVTELDVSYKELSFFTRVVGFYDFEIEGGSTRRTPLSSRATQQLGRNIDLLDIYLAYNTDINTHPVSLKVGNQVLNWGESTFIQNGLNVINPVDLAKLRTAGAEVREALLPVPMIVLDIGITDQISITGFWQQRWKEIKLDPKGTYFSDNDFISPGAQFAMIESPSFNNLVNLVAFIQGTPQSDITPLPLTFAKRGNTHYGDNDGNYGGSIRYFAPSLNDSEFGLYGMVYTSRLPVVSAMRGSNTNPSSLSVAEQILVGQIQAIDPTNPQFLLTGAAIAAGTSEYFVEYPDDIVMVGASFNTMIKTIAFQGEFSHKFGHPIQVDDAVLLANVLTGTGPLGTFGDFSYVRGWRRKDVSQLQLTATKEFGPKFKSDSFVVIAEVGGTYIWNLEPTSQIKYSSQGPGSPSSFGWGYRLLLRAVYNNAIGPITLTPQLAISHDVQGSLPRPIPIFVKDRVTTTATLLARYLSWSANLSYTNFTGGHANNALRDRDFASLSMSYSF